MVRAFLFAIVSGLILTPLAWAQNGAWHFRWQQGQTLTYIVEHMTSAAEVVGDSKSDTRTKLNLTKHWQVLDVDASGVATLQLSLAALRLEATTPTGGVLLFDSEDAAKSDEHMRQELGKFVGQPLALLRMDVYGRVVEVKESKHGPASRFDSELPFVFTLPAGAPAPGQEWSRVYKITLAPPQGTGEKYDALQKYVCKAVANGLATMSLSTELKNMPENMLDRVPLLQLQPEGEVVFDIAHGRLHSASLKIDKELKGHQGEGSSYRFQSSYTEKYVEGK
jgi:hypothetical protein